MSSMTSKRFAMMMLCQIGTALFASCSSLQKVPAWCSTSLCALDESSRARRAFLQKSVFLGISSNWLSIDAATSMTNDPKTGISLPSEGEIEGAIPLDWDPIDNPFGDDYMKQTSSFSRLDTSPDSIFYTEPRFVEHVDESAVQTITNYISNMALHNGDSVLDLCSSWTSHIDLNQPGTTQSLKRVSGLGMNAKELSANPVLTDWTVRDLNLNPRLPYDDKSFDVVLCQLSIDYLTRPKEVLQEVARVLKPGGMIHVLFSNRMFLSKAIGLWTGADDIDHAYLVGSYLHFCDAGFTNISAHDLSKRSGRERRIVGDPVYVVTAEIFSS